MYVRISDGTRALIRLSFVPLKFRAINPFTSETGHSPVWLLGWETTVCVNLPGECWFWLKYLTNAHPRFCFPCYVSGTTV